MINYIHYAEECGHVEELHNDELHKQAKEWLKSLRPQTTWKPSNKKIVALEKILKYFRMLNAFGETIDELKELEEQLKKLREE